MAMASIQSTHRRAGANAAGHILQITPQLGTVPDTVTQAYDAVAVEAILEHDLIDVRTTVERGDRVEIKSTIVRQASGGRGQFNFRKKQHDRLEAVDGKYLLLVCEPKPDRRVLAAALVDASELTESDASWIEFDAPGRAETAFKQIRWGVLIDPEDVPGEGTEVRR